jgi:hypothetical protein
MKAIWALFALLAIAAVVMFARGGDKTQAPESPATPSVATPAAPAPPTIEPPVAPKPESVALPAQQPGQLAPLPSANQSAAAAPPATAPDSPPATTEQPQPATPDPSPANPEPSQQATAAPAAPAAEPPAPIANPTPASTEDENLLIKLRQEIEAERAKRDAEAKALQASPPTAAPPPPTPSESSGLFGTAAAESKPDGSILVEGKYLIKGKGTQEAPYKVTWDHLISAERDYAPKEGKKSIPPRIQALNDSWVEITGYVAFPLMANETDELLSMMNQWDGCCIGIPPTPYDAIEVRLSTAVGGDARLTTYGTIKGKFKVDPHLVGGWLVGLYVIDQGKLTPVAFGGVAP